MTKLCEMIMECRAIGIDDRVILYGWASQLEEGNDMLYCSKTTVGDFLGVSDDTVLRRTKRLVKSGVMIDTGGRKQWPFGWTPVYSINVPMIVGLWEAQYRSLRPPAECTPPQIAAQGTNALSGVRSSGLSGCCAGALSPSTGVPPVAGESKSKEAEPEDLTPVEPVEAKPTPVPTPAPHGQKNLKVCPKCTEPWSRYKNHVCSMPDSLMLKQDMDEYTMGDWKPSVMDDSQAPYDRDWAHHAEPLFPSLNSPQAEEARKRVEAAGQKSEESIMAEGRTTTRTNASTAQPPVAPAPLSPCMVCAKAPVRSETSDYCLDCWNERQRTGVIPKFVDEIRPTGISP